MTITRDELATSILHLLTKTTTKPGFFTSAKVALAIQEAIDFVAVEMFLAGEGWLTEVSYHNVTDGMATLAFPARMAMISEVRLRVNGSEEYTPLMYEPAYGEPAYGATTEVRQGNRYKTIGTNIVFNPPLRDAGTNYLMLEGIYFPTRYTTGTDLLGGQFLPAMYHYAKYKAASILAASIEKYNTPWSTLEREWWDRCMNVINRRNSQSRPIREFGG